MSESRQSSNRTWKDVLFPSWQRRKQLFVPQAWAVLAVAYCAIVVSQAIPVPLEEGSGLPRVVAWTAFVARTLTFHIGLFVLLVAALALVLKRWRILLATLPLLAFSLLPEMVTYVPRRPHPPGGERLSILSINLLHANSRTRAVCEVIRSAAPDIILLQEYTYEWNLALSDHLAEDWPHRATAPRSDSFGMALYSRQPFIDEVEKSLSLGEAYTPQFRAMIRHDGREIALYNIHLLPPKPTYFAEQVREFADLLDLLENEPLPVVLAGDFNFTSASTFADRLKAKSFRDVHDLAGYGRGRTWCQLQPLRYLPGWRLDHVYLSEELTAATSRTLNVPGSDHKAVSAEVVIRGTVTAPVSEISPPLEAAEPPTHSETSRTGHD